MQKKEIKKDAVGEQNYRLALLRAYENKKKSNPLYSKRQFAKSLGISPTLLSLVLAGKRGFSIKRATGIFPKIVLSREERELYLTQIRLELSRSESSREKFGRKLSEKLLTQKTVQLAVDRFEIISNWYHIAIVEFLSLRSASLMEKELITQISKAFKLSSAEINFALDRLERLELIERTEGRVYALCEHVISNQGVASAAVRDFHQQTLQKAQRALETQDVVRRCSNSITFSVRHADRESIQKEIFEFQSRILKKFGSNSKNKDGDEVYALSLQFFSLQEEK